MTTFCVSFRRPSVLLRYRDTEAFLEQRKVVTVNWAWFVVGAETHSPLWRDATHWLPGERSRAGQ